MCWVMAFSVIWRSMGAGIASTSTDSPANRAALVSVRLVGRVGKPQSPICSSVTASHSKCSHSSTLL